MDFKKILMTALASIFIMSHSNVFSSSEDTKDSSFFSLNKKTEELIIFPLSVNDESYTKPGEDKKNITDNGPDSLNHPDHEDWDERVLDDWPTSKL